MSQCPVCHHQFPDSVTHCEFDGHELEADAPQPAAGHDPSAAQTLAELISSQAPFEIKRAVRLAISACQALEGLHRAGRITGALHPQDILIAAPGQTNERVLSIKPGEQDSLASEKEMERIAAYISPEAAQQQPSDPRSDLYSLGVILYEMLAGQPPFKASSAAAVIIKQILEQPRPLREVRPEVPLTLQEVVLRALEKEKSSRQQSPTQFKRELEAALSQMYGTGAFDSKDRDQRARDFGVAPMRTLIAPSAPAAPRAVMAPHAGQPTLMSAPMASPRRVATSMIIIAALLGVVIVGILAFSLLSLKSTAPSRDAVPVGSAPSSTPSVGSSPNPAPSSPISTAPPPAERTMPVVIILIAGAAVGALVIIILVRQRRKASVPERPAVTMEPASSPLPADREPPAARPAPQMAMPSSQSAPPERRTRGASRGEKNQFATQMTSVTGAIGESVHRPSSAPEDSKRCPSCRREYPSTTRFCLEDGTRLIETPRAEKQPPAEASPAPDSLPTVVPKKQCPQCRAEYSTTKKFCRVDGRRLVEVAASPEPAERSEEIEPFMIGQYRCFARLGEGGMGVVYKAHHVHLERLSAVKVLLPQTAILPDAVKMFRREARLASSINHPNSVIIYDYGEVSAQLFYLAMEFIQGRTLAEIIQPKGQPPRPLPLPRALQIIRQVCDALDTAHQAGIIHRDLKPQNVMVCEKPNRPDLVKVVDFGLARSLVIQSEYQTQQGTVMGTPAYMSPEQADGSPEIDASSDLFSLGVMTYQMLSGILPFPAAGLTPRQQVNQRALLAAPPPPLSRSRPDLKIPAAVDLALGHALEPDRRRRTPSAAQFFDELEQAARG